jgi:hypothetical protein
MNIMRLYHRIQVYSATNSLSAGPGLERMLSLSGGESMTQTLCPASTQDICFECTKTDIAGPTQYLHNEVSLQGGPSTENT